jgi:hypothetical protein
VEAKRTSRPKRQRRPSKKDSADPGDESESSGEGLERRSESRDEEEEEEGGNAPHKLVGQGDMDALFWPTDGTEAIDPSVMLDLSQAALGIPGASTSVPSVLPMNAVDMWYSDTTAAIDPLANDLINLPDLSSVMPFGQNGSTVPDGIDDMWKMIFSNNDAASSALFSSMTNQSPPHEPSPTVLSPDPFPPFPQNNILTTVPDTALSNMGYIHHFLNFVLPLQFRSANSLAIGAIVAPLAFQKSEILTSISSLAALHLASQRNGDLGTLAPVITFGQTLPSNVAGDTDAIIARTAHRDVIDRLRFISSENLASEDVIVPALFAVSYYLFMGGTSSQWREVTAVVQKCLFAALAASPDLTGDYSALNRSAEQCGVTLC